MKSSCVSLAQRDEDAGGPSRLSEAEAEAGAGAERRPGCSRDVDTGDGHHRPYSLPASERVTRRSVYTLLQATSSNSPGHYATDLCTSPVASSVSGESMNDHGDGDDITPPESLAKAGLSHARTATEQIGRLSLDHGIVKGASSPPCRGRGMLSADPVVVTKRSASSELQRPGGHQVPRCCNRPRASQPLRISKMISRPLRRGPHEVQSNVRESPGEDHPSKAVDRRCEKPRQPVRDDSGYASQHPSQYSNTCGNAPPRMILESTVPQKPLGQLQAHARYSDLMMQPRSSPISKEQLAGEVKGIYAGLVMVEAKCTSVDTAQAEDTRSTFEPEQWQALIALHRTLLYEHHDFLMATQHPSATPALRCLPAKYNMPARMWKHGIHAFLEVLRHRRPHAQQYMLAFIYLAYQMMALLYETVPSFTDTWIECLGDLARYRMAIEEEKEAHATWGGVAARWYTMASDRHPAIGRLYHHLGILERPSLRKFCFYAKALTCVIPFQNARDSLSTLCTPIIQDERTVQSSSQSAEARIVTYHALLYVKADQETAESVGKDALNLIQQQPSRLREFGTFLAVTNIAALFNLGDPLNSMWQLYMAAINLLVKTGSSTVRQCPLKTPKAPSSASLASSTRFWSSTFALIVRRPVKENWNGACSLRDCLPYVNVMLIWIHSLLALETRLSDKAECSVVLPIDLGGLAWDGLAEFLNTLVAQEGISPRIVEYARRGVFAPPLPERSKKAMPLAEDYLIRGLVWGQFYFCPGWFEGQGEDDGRGIETAEKLKARSERVLLLGLYLSFHCSYLRFDELNKKFFAGCDQKLSVGDETTAAAANGIAVVYAAADAAELTHESEAETSSSSTSEDGFTIVNKPRMENVKAVTSAASRAKRSTKVK